MLKGKGQDCPSRVGTYPGELEQCIEIVGDRARVPILDLPRTTMQHDRTTVVPETIPQRHDLTSSCLCSSWGCGESFEEREPFRDHPIHLRLLRHDLAHENRPRITRLTPRQLAVVVPPPRRHMLHERSVSLHAPIMSRPKLPTGVGSFDPIQE